MISSTFSAKIETDKNAKEIGEFNILINGYKKTKEENLKSHFNTRFFQHIWFHPNFLVSKSTLEIIAKEHQKTIIFKVFYPIPILILVCNLMYQFLVGETQFIGISILFLLAYYTYIHINQKLFSRKSFEK